MAAEGPALGREAQWATVGMGPGGSWGGDPEPRPIGQRLQGTGPREGQGTPEWEEERWPIPNAELRLTLGRHRSPSDQTLGLTQGEVDPRVCWDGAQQHVPSTDQVSGTTGHGNTSLPSSRLVSHLVSSSGLLPW